MSQSRAQRLSPDAVLGLCLGRAKRGLYAENYKISGVYLRFLPEDVDAYKFSGSFLRLSISIEMWLDHPIISSASDLVSLIRLSISVEV